MGKFLVWPIKLRWLLISLTILLLIFHEWQEPQVSPMGYWQFAEYIIYVLFLISLGLLVELLLRSNTQQTRSLNLLDQKHRLSIDLAVHENWNDLVNYLVQYPNTLAPTDEAILLIYDSLSAQFEKLGTWQKRAGEKPAMSQSESPCQQCAFHKLDFRNCHLQDVSSQNADHSHEYCLPIRYGKQTLALLRFKLETNVRLTQEQEEIFNNIGDEMGVAIKVHRERKSLNEMQFIETSLAERRTVSHYLHDNLGQNLAYLCLKLDQLKQNQDLLPYQNDIELMFSAANQSYEIIRKTLETNHPATVPVLANLLAEHANRVSKRANLEIVISRRGKPVFFPAEVQRAVFYVFQEVLSNVEKHAKARRVDVLLNWYSDQLLLKISDDGVGFDPQAVDPEKHFGLGIMLERIAQVNGNIDFISSENSGTVVTITIPLSCEVVEGAPNELST